MSRKQNLDNKKPRNNANGKIPHGRDEVKKAILNAAEKLLLKRSPSEVTVREIATAANVKHPLIYRHFGTKNGVILAVHTRKLEKVAKITGKVEALEGSIKTFFQTFEKDKWRQIALARAMIDGIDPRLIQNQFPIMEQLVALLKKRQNELDEETKFDAETMATVLGAIGLGWFLFEPFLLAATRLDEKNKDEIRLTVIEIIEEIIKKVR